LISIADRRKQFLSLLQQIQNFVADIQLQDLYLLAKAFPEYFQIGSGSYRSVQMNDAPRGPLLHSMTTANEEIASYRIITPNAWNFSPRDETGMRGPAEESLIGAVVGILDDSHKMNCI
jgi:Ni,Fe-hydrogenase I large subunit